METSLRAITSISPRARGKGIRVEGPGMVHPKCRRQYLKLKSRINPLILITRNPPRASVWVMDRREK